MSKCMTIDEAYDQKDTRTEITAKDIVEFVLEEALHSAVIISDKGYSRIGDFNVNEDFCQQFDQSRYLKDFERINNPTTTNQEFYQNSGEKIDHSVTLPTGIENLELGQDTFGKKDEIAKPVGECKVISEDILADNELKIENGQILLGNNKIDNGFLGKLGKDYTEKVDVIKNKKIEIEYYNEGKLNKIIVPYTCSDEPSGIPHKISSDSLEPKIKSDEQSDERLTSEFRPKKKENDHDDLCQFTPFAIDDHKEVYTEDTMDPNRPRACATGEDEVIKMTKEIEEINFNQNHSTAEDLDMAYHTDGQGDADLESKSFTCKSKENLGKPSKVQRFQDESSNNTTTDSMSFVVKSIDDLGEPFCGQKELEVLSSEKMKIEPEKDLLPEAGSSLTFQGAHSLPQSELLTECCGFDVEGSQAETSMMTINSTAMKGSRKNLNTTDNVQGELHLEYEVVHEECLLNSRLYNESILNGTTSFQDMSPAFYEQSSIAYTQSKFAGHWDPQNSSSEFTIFQTDSENLINSLNKANVYEDFSPVILPASSSTTKVVEPETENDNSPNDIRTYSETKSTIIFEKKPDMRSRSTSDAPQDYYLELSHRDSPGVNSLGRYKTNNEIDEEPLNFITLSGERGFKMTAPETNSTGTERETPQEARGFSPQFNSSTEAIGRSADIFHYGDDPYLLPEKINEKLEKSFRDSEMETVEATQDREIEKEPSSEDGGDIKCAESNFLESENGDDDGGNVMRQVESEKSLASSHTHVIEHTTESQLDNGADNLSPQSFKLHSQKMYSRMNFCPGGREGTKFTLTESEEAFIESTETVLQIIEPSTDNSEEDYKNISFSMLLGSGPLSDLTSVEPNPELPPPSNNDSTLREKENTTYKKAVSGMTTIGPIKITDYDPKDLSGPDIDFGKMTRITSSRQLEKDIFGSELVMPSSVKILEDDDSDEEDDSVTIEGEHVEVTSLVNRDIASLTKVQKVREVMSYHPKSDEYFEEDDTLTRPRLDLKDVESVTDERYKVPDVSIPLLSFEVTENDEADKEFVQNMNLVLSGNCFNSAGYYEEDLEEDNVETNRLHMTVENDYVKVTNSPDERLEDEDNSKSEKEDKENDMKISSDHQVSQSKVEINEGSDEDQSKFEPNLDPDSDSHREVSSNIKYGTLSSVFKKASNKFIRKDSDLFLRNSKSLPRDTAKLTSGTESIRSILDECQASASNVLKKSRSLLKNTQGIFKTISQTRFTTQDSGHSMDKEKISPSESHVHNIEKKLSSLLRKEDFAKAKNLLKSKLEKSLKNVDGASASSSQVDIASGQKDLRIAVRNEDNYRVDQIENFQKLLPKSPLVYKSQFVKSQISVPNEFPEGAKIASVSDLGDNQPVLLTKNNRISNEPVPLQPEESEKEIVSPLEEKLNEGKLSWAGEKGDLHPLNQEEENEPSQPEYIVLETVQGLPVSDLDSPSAGIESEKVCENAEMKDHERGNDEQAKSFAASYSHQATADSDNSPSSPEREQGRVMRKMSTKQKKFTARFRSFWCSAFGRVKTPHKKRDLS